jgi:hypothetical protein
MLQTYRPRANDEVPTREQIVAETQMRIDQWSRMFGLTPPKVQTYGGAIVSTPALEEWMRKSLAPDDFIFGGDMHLILERYRRYTAALIVARMDAERQAEVLLPGDIEPEPDDAGGMVAIPFHRDHAMVFSPVRSIDDAIDVTPRG